MGSNTSDVCLQPISASQSFGVGDNVKNISFILVHPINYHTEVCLGILLRLVPVLGVLFTFMSKKKQYGLYIKFGSYPEVDIRTSVV